MAYVDDLYLPDEGKFNFLVFFFVFHDD
jgi:hypothetical protein